MSSVTVSTRHLRSLRAVLAAALVATLLVAAPGTAAAEQEHELVVTGSGWGHGVGMSQYGAYAMSTTGSSVAEILEHYYTGSSLGTLGLGGLPAAAPLWVNLERDFSSLTLRVIDISGTTTPVTLSRGAESWMVEVGSTIDIAGSSTCALTITPPVGDVVEIPSGVCEFDISWYDFTDPGAAPPSGIAIEGCTNTDWNVVPTTQRECRYARGMVHLRSGSGGLDLSVELLIDDYIYGISEMPYYWGDTGGMEALKAQAIAARSYAHQLQLVRGDPAANSCGGWCHVRDTTWDQRYVGTGHGAATNWVAATNATKGQVITHPAAPAEGNGVVRGYYSSSSGGATESAHEVWSTFTTPRPYFTSADDSWAVDGTVTNTNASWTASLDPESVADALGLETIAEASVIARNTSGSAKTLEFTDGVTTVTTTASWLRTTFGLKSIYFDLQVLGTPPGFFVDIAGNVHHDQIHDIHARGITRGCNPPLNTMYCPERSISKGELAAFLNRAFDFPSTSQDFYTDDTGSIFEDDINRIAAAGVVVTCGGAKLYCPAKPVLREEMASFLAQAFGYTKGANIDAFIDDNSSQYETAINLIAHVGVTKGCNPPANDEFCPKREVRRDEMASFFDRALDLAGM